MIKKPAGGYKLIFGYFGLFLILIGIICLLPLFMLFFYPGEANELFSFLIPGLSSIIVGILLSLLIIKRDKMRLGKFQDAILLVGVWLLAILVGAVPFMLRGVFSVGDFSYSMGFADSVFESTSGYSATGLTVFNFDTSAPGYHLFTFYRSCLLLFGGIGLVLIVTSAISDRYGLKLYTAEGHNDKLMPNLAKSARLILLIYLGYIFLGTLSYYFIGGLTLFDAVNHSIAAVATGGFSTHPDGLPGIIAAGGINNLNIPINAIAINITSVILMILGSTNFLLHLFLFKGKIKNIVKDCEIRFFGIMCIIFIPMFFGAVMTSKITSNDPFLALSDGAFLFFTSISTTGFSTVSHIKALGEAAVLLAMIMMIIGGGMGSTAGALKQYRVVIAFKSLYWSIRDRLAPKSKYYPHTITRLGQTREIEQMEIYESLGYIILYITIMLLGGVSLAMISGGVYGASDCLFEFASALSGTGLSVGVTNGLVWQEASGTMVLAGLAMPQMLAIRWVLVAAMFAGRLEITCIYFAFFRIVRDILRKETI